MKDTILRNRYKILQFLGSGSFGDTYIAEDLDLPGKPKCVVKQLKPKTFEQEVMLVARRLFKREAEVLYHLGSLSNQIPKLFAHFEENGEFYLVQEFIDGYDLSTEIIPGIKWSEGEVIKLLKEILEVLTVVHQENIIHRDIKPQNLIRRRDGKIVMIDFGAVKEIKGLSANTQGRVTSTIAIGSNGYMPPEQANSKPKFCSDIYAVGAIGIQALTGKLPKDFQEDPATGEIIWRHEANVSDRLAEVLTKMVRYNFSHRYQTAAEALQALTSLPSRSQSPSLSLLTFALQTSENPKVLLGAGVTVGALLSVGLLFITCLRQPTPDTRSVLVATLTSTAQESSQSQSPQSSHVAASDPSPTPSVSPLGTPTSRHSPDVSPTSNPKEAQPLPKSIPAPVPSPPKPQPQRQAQPLPKSIPAPVPFPKTLVQSTPKLRPQRTTSPLTLSSAAQRILCQKSPLNSRCFGKNRSYQRQPRSPVPSSQKILVQSLPKPRPRRTISPPISPDAQRILCQKSPLNSRCVGKNR